MNISDGALVSLGIFLVLQLIGAVAWASAINTKMDFMLLAAREFSKEKSAYSTKEEVNTALALANKNVEIALSSANKELVAIWKQIDIIRGIRGS